jgi:hypothetical protein
MLPLSSYRMIKGSILPALYYYYYYYYYYYRMNIREMEWECVDWLHLAQDIGTTGGLL